MGISNRKPVLRGDRSCIGCRESGSYQLPEFGRACVCARGVRSARGSAPGSANPNRGAPQQRQLLGRPRQHWGLIRAGGELWLRLELEQP